jgi:amphi-Trp domain-containing protein
MNSTDSRPKGATAHRSGKTNKPADIHVICENQDNAPVANERKVLEKPGRTGKLDFKSNSSAKEVAGFLRQIANGIANGSLELNEDGKIVDFAGGNRVKLKVKGKSKPEKSKIKISLSWRDASPVSTKASEKN